MKIDKLQYFGTSLNNHGHYCWELSGDRMDNRGLYFGNIPFNPEEIAPRKFGEVSYNEIDGYFICAIGGSCYDKRGGTKSVFWTQDKIKLEYFPDIIMSIPVAQKIIDQMPFKIEW